MSETTDRSVRPGGWDAGLYDEKHAFVWKAGADLLDLLAPLPGERILDLGCGTGHLTHAIAERGAHVLGIDASPEMIAAARAAYPSIPFQVERAEDFAFPEPFDAVFSNAALHWMTDPEPVVANVARALRPGGRFVAECGGKGNVARIMAALRDALRAEAPDVPIAWPWYFPSIAEYGSRLEARGLEVTFAVLFDRPTPLAGPDGLREWLRMFAFGILSGLSEEERAAVVDRVVDACRPDLFRDGAWFADYRRLRFVAVRRAP